MPEKRNQDRIKEYLVGYEKNDEHIKGYLEKDISNGKVIMLSGKWGSGKTRFWQNKIASDILKKELNGKNSAYSYISLYGKSSIEEIENDIFGQIYFSAIGGDNLATKIFSTFTKYSKRYGKLLPSFDLSKLADSLQEEQADNKERTALERLNNGGIICFDDFERKSKDIDLNDLFGFITQLTLNFKCKVVIILNDDVFEGEEKAIFTNVKEKTVSKFLKYEPSIEELFNSIFDLELDNKKEKKYKELEPYRDIIIKTIEETQELNARIFFQILDNLLEWIDKKQEIDDDILRCLILVNINFILYHTTFIREKKLKNSNDIFTLHKISKLSAAGFNYFSSCSNGSFDFLKEEDTFEEYKMKLMKKKIDIKDISEEKVKDIKQFIKNNINLFKSDYFANKLDISRNIDDKTFQKINNFIETGILLDD